jgi:hypothetical protein
MKPVKFLFAILLLAASVCELSAQSSSSATQTVTFGVTRIVPGFLASMQMVASSINESFAVQTSAVKMTVGSETHSKQVTGLAGSYFQSRIAANGDPEATSSAQTSLAMLKAQKPKSNKLVITVTE